MYSTDNTTNIVLAGVGGQGVLLISELLARTSIAAGYDAKQTEIHGVSQRGGSVYSHVRFGKRVYSPLIIPGQADAIVGLEKLEALRFASFIKPTGVLIINDHEVIPRSAGVGADAYPHQTIDYLKENGLRVIDIPASTLATELGNVRVANIILLGVLSTQLSIPLDVWDAMLNKRIPEKFLTINQKAFAMGRELATQPV